MRLLGGGARRGVAQIVLGTVVGQGLLIAISPILSRLYGPVDFGVLQVFTGVVAITAVVASLRLELAIPLASDVRQARAVLRVGLLAVAVVAVAVWLIGWLSSDLWATTRTLRGLADAWWLVPFTLAAIAVFQLVSAMLTRAERYGDLAGRNAAQGIGTAAAQLGFGIAGVRPLGLLLGMSIGRLAGLATLAGRRSRSEPVGSIGTADLRAALSRFRRFPLVTTWSGVLNVCGQYAPFFVFALTYGDKPTGWLAFTARLLAVPVTVIGQAVAQVFIGRGAAARRDETGDLPRLVRLAVRRLAVLGAGPAVLLAVIGPWAFQFVFGDAWERSGQYAQVLAIAFLAQFVAGPIGNVFNLLERQGIALLLDASRLFLVVAAPTVVWLAGGSDLAGVTAYAVVLTVSYLGVITVAWRVLRVPRAL